jgi:uncharacterized protein (DUF488 family)
MQDLKLFTIGFTKKSAEEFFTKLREAGVKRVIDVRLNNTSQLAGFSKRDDLEFFLREICGIDYVPCPLLAPTQTILDAYKKRKGDWSVYEEQFLNLMAQRHIEQELSPDLLDGGCLLCSEDEPNQCHRRLVAEYLANQWRSVSIVHIT